MKPRLESPPPIRVVARGLSGMMKAGIELAEANPGKWVRAAQYKNGPSARSTGDRFRKRGYEVAVRGRVVYVRTVD